MSIAVIYSRAVSGMVAECVTVEVHLSNGLPGMSMVGLPETAVRESKDRVRSAIVNSGFEFPARRITINLAPADLPKEGGGFDLPIAMGILAASGQVDMATMAQVEFIGELALTGELRGVRGVIPVALKCSETSHSLFLPWVNRDEAAVVSGLTGYAANTLKEVCAHLNGKEPLSPLVTVAVGQCVMECADLEDVRGQEHARRALEIAAAGEHSLLFVGPPGTGKSMLASRLPGLLPTMTEREAIETAALLSITGKTLQPEEWQTRPFRAPHHTASAVALVGGGAIPRPGEISLSHHGVLFLDELPEFDRKVLEVLREPLESGQITLSRAARQASFPARFQLVAAMNPCPCGYFGDQRGACRCTPDQIQRYRSKLSGPLMDRIDMHVTVPRVSTAEMRHAAKGENSATVRKRVEAVRQRQLARQAKPNGHLNTHEVERFCTTEPDAETLLDQAAEQFGLSGRAVHRVLKLARTLADMQENETISKAHIGEAISYRAFDRMQTV